MDEVDFAGFTITSEGIKPMSPACVRFSVSLTRYRTCSLVRKKCNHFGSYLKKTLNGIGTRR